MREGELKAMSRAVTELERLSGAAPALLRAMQPYLGHAVVVGFTGPPGAGKSTLVNAVIAALRARDLTVGVIAVDPSSPVSGGSILGDRIRMTGHTSDDGVFVRSLASRGTLGGLCPAAVRVIDAFDAAGKDVILLETVGTGQSEIDIAEIADIRVLVAAPGLGDDVQAMKAGVIEIADLIAVNKADLDTGGRTLQQLKAALALRTLATKDCPVLRTVATTGEGVEELTDAILQSGDAVRATPAEARRLRRARHLIALAAGSLIDTRIRGVAADDIAPLCDAVLSGEVSADEAAMQALKAQTGDNRPDPLGVPPSRE